MMAADHVNSSGMIQTRFACLRVWLDTREGLDLRQQVLIFFVAAAIIFSRLPSLLLHPQFYAEDGFIWYEQAYQSGWLHSLTLPNVGYLTTLPRIGAGFAYLMPFRWAPLVMASFGLIIQCLPVTVLLSKRCRSFGPLSLRAAFVIWYLGCPNAREIHIVATNTQWHLGVVVGLLSFADPPKGWAGRFFDIFVFSVLGLSAPFCIVLAPLTMIYFLFRRRQWTLVQALILFASAFIQIMMLHKDAHRVIGPLGASVSLFLRIFGVNIIGAGIFGGFAIERLLPIAVALLASIGGATLYIYVLRFAGLEQKLFTLFCLGIFLGSLRSPFAGSVLPAWEVLTNIPSCRYWFFPMLAFLWGVIWCARFAQHIFVKRLAAYTVMFSTIGLLAQWEYKAYPNYNFPAADQRFRKASAGSPVTIPIIPQGWSMTINKKGPSGSDR